jgi:hypothetical protein
LQCEVKSNHTTKQSFKSNLGATRRRLVENHAAAGRAFRGNTRLQKRFSSAPVRLPLVAIPAPASIAFVFRLFLLQSLAQKQSQINVH